MKDDDYEDDDGLRWILENRNTVKWKMAELFTANL